MCHLKHLKISYAKTEFFLFTVSHVWNELTLQLILFLITVLELQKPQAVYTWLKDYEFKLVLLQELYLLFAIKLHVVLRGGSNTADIYLLKVSNRNTRTSCEIFSKLTKKTLASF